MESENVIEHSSYLTRQKKRKKTMTSLYNERMKSEYSRKIGTRSKKASLT